MRPTDPFDGTNQGASPGPGRPDDVVAAAQEVGTLLRADDVTMPAAHRRAMIEAALDEAFGPRLLAQSGLGSDHDSADSTTSSSTFVRRWFPKLAAACLVIVVGAGLWAAARNLSSDSDDSAQLSAEAFSSTDEDAAAPEAKSEESTVQPAGRDGTDQDAVEASAGADSNAATAGDAPADDAVVAAARSSQTTVATARPTSSPPAALPSAAQALPVDRVFVSDLTLQEFAEVLNGTAPEALPRFDTPVAGAMAPFDTQEADQTAPTAASDLYVVPTASEALVNAARQYVASGVACEQANGAPLYAVFEVEGAIVRVYQDANSGTLASFDEDCRPVE